MRDPCPISGGEHVSEGTCGLCGQVMSDQAALPKEALPKSLHVEVVYLGDGCIATCPCAFCDAVKSALADARKIGRETQLVLTLIPGEARPAKH